MKIISQYLEMLGNLNRAVDEFYYKSVNDFMKQEGKFYESANLTEDELAHFEQIFNRAGRPRTKKMCFYNAQMIALADKTKKLKYVEGYAVNIFPLPLNHGWLEINGKVIDAP